MRDVGARRFDLGLSMLLVVVNVAALRRGGQRCLARVTIKATRPIGGTGSSVPGSERNKLYDQQDSHYRDNLVSAIDRIGPRRLGPRPRLYGLLINGSLDS